MESELDLCKDESVDLGFNQKVLSSFLFEIAIG